MDRASKILKQIVPVSDSAPLTPASTGSNQTHVHLHITNESGRGTNGPSPRDLEILNGALGDRDIKITHGFTVPDDSNYQVLVSGMPKEDMVKDKSNLKVVCVPWAGIVPKMKTMMQKYPEIDTHSIHHNSAPTAELALGLLLAASKKIVECDGPFRKNDWRNRYNPDMQPMFLGDKTAMICGFGRVGRLIGDSLLTLGMKVIATDYYELKGLDPRVSLYKPDKLPELLPKTNIVILCLPDTPQTRDSFGRKQFESMPPNSIVVNVGRAHVCHQQDLYECLKDGTLGAAGLDVWWHYPSARKGEAARISTAPAEFPFGELANVVMSPHRGGVAKEIDDMRMRHIAEVIAAVHDKKKVPGKLNLKLGF